MFRRFPLVLMTALASVALIVFVVVKNIGPAPEPGGATQTDIPAAEPKGEPSFAPAQLPEAPKITRPVVDADMVKRLDRLRATFAPGGSSPNRFRLLQELREQWGGSPPVGLLLFEATDPEAPPKYRDYFARSLRNLGKMSQEGGRDELAAKMRQAMDDSPAGAPHLAHALIAFDDSPESLRAVEAQLQARRDDAATAGLLAALTLSHVSEARIIVLEETRWMTADPDAYPLSLSAALPALAREQDLRVEEEIERVLSKTTDRTLYLTALRCCFVRQPGGAAIQAVGTALERVGSFGTAEQEQLHRAIRFGLERWQRQHPETSSPTIQQLLDKIP